MGREGTTENGGIKWMSIHWMVRPPLVLLSLEYLDSQAVIPASATQGKSLEKLTSLIKKELQILILRSIANWSGKLLISL